MKESEAFLGQTEIITQNLSKLKTKLEAIESTEQETLTSIKAKIKLAEETCHSLKICVAEIEKNCFMGLQIFGLLFPLEEHNFHKKT